MRIRYREPGIELQREQVIELARIYPEGRIDEWRFGFDLAENDPRLHQILKYLEEIGMKPREKGSPVVEGKHFLLEIWRDYELSDFASVRYVRMLPTAKGNGLFRDEIGRVKM